MEVKFYFRLHMTDQIPVMNNYLYLPDLINALNSSREVELNENNTHGKHPDGTVNVHFAVRRARPDHANHCGDGG